MKISKSKFETFLLLSPFLTIFGVFGIFPIVFSLITSFTDYTALSGKFNFIGINNYLKVFSDEIFLKALFNTTLFVICTVPTTTVIALVLAVFINSKAVKNKEIFKAGFFLPSVISMVVISTMWLHIYSSDGILNRLIKVLNLPIVPTSWLAYEKTALLAIMIMDIWAAFGYYIILFIAGLQAIPEHLYEAAAIDGAGKTEIFFKITLPLLKPTTFFCISINTIRSFQIFSEIFTMTGGGPANSTQTIVHYLYITGFRRFEMGYASAIAYVLVFIVLIITAIQNKMFRGEQI